MSGQGHLILEIYSVEVDTSPWVGKGGNLMAESYKTAGVSLWDIFATVPVPRDASGKRFQLQGILALTVAALLAGRQELCSIARWGRGCSKKQLARLGIERPKSPCHATYHNLGIHLTLPTTITCGLWSRILPIELRGPGITSAAMAIRAFSTVSRPRTPSSSPPQ